MTADPAHFERLAGRLCLDFVNTVHARPFSPETRDYLTSYQDLLAWARGAGVVGARQARTLARKAAGQPTVAARTLRDALELRELIYRLFACVIRGKSPARADIDLLSARLATALAERRLRFRDGRFEAQWPADRDALECLSWPVVQSAAKLLCGNELDRVGECPPPEGCGWLFYDTSKNRSRRWCSMRTCGNAAKARRHYARTRRKRRNPEPG